MAFENHRLKRLYILQITFADGKNYVEYHHMPIECVDTYRPKIDMPAKQEMKPEVLSEKEQDDILLDPCESLTP